ncbi:hypothetical protein OQA88_11985 [Cercophora sp. LCS_1]
MDNSQQAPGAGNIYPDDDNAQDAGYANSSYSDPTTMSGEFGNMPHPYPDGGAYAPMVVAEGHGQYLIQAHSIDTASYGAYSQHQWAAGPSAKTSLRVDNQVSDMNLSPGSTTTDTTPYPYQAEYFQQSSNPVSIRYPSSFTTNSPWTTATSLSPTPSSQSQSQEPFSATTGTLPKPPQPPAKRKRGRPRLYEDDGTEVPKETPGRPSAYTFASRSSGSSSSKTRASTSTSASSVSITVVPNTRPRPNSDAPDQDSSKQKSVRARNKAAATRYRQKTQAAIAEWEAQEQEVSLQRQALMACAGKLKEEVFQLKNEVLRHADCGCPMIEGYLATAAQQAFMSSGEGRTDGGISQGMDQMALTSQDDGTARVMHLEECSMLCGEGGYIEGWQGQGAGYDAERNSGGEGEGE